MYILYGGRFTRVLIVEMVMAEGAIPYELRNIDIVAHQHRKPEYLAVNPAGWVPALEEQGLLAPCPAIRHCLKLVTARPGLRPHFERQKAWGKEYAEMQARGEGVR